LGKGCFGASGWQDTFYRDLRLAKRALEASGNRLSYSRSEQRPGYYLVGQPALSAELKWILRGSDQEADQGQIDISQRLSPAERFRQGSSLSDTARNVVAYCIRQEDPKLSPAEANKLALQRAYHRG